MVKRRRVEKKKEEELAPSNGVVVERQRGTLTSLEQFLREGVIQEGQLCSLERGVDCRITASLQCVLTRDTDGRVNFLPCGEVFSGKPRGRVLTQSFVDWLAETEFCDQDTLPNAGVAHFYDLIRFHFTLQSHPSLVTTVPVSSLSLIQKSPEKWKPVLHKKVAEEESSLPADAVGVWVAFYDATGKEPTLFPVKQGDRLAIPDNTLYGLELQNKLEHRHIAASVYIDGRHQGKFILRPKQVVTLERPLNEARRFLFLLQGAQHASSDIYIRFTPESHPSTLTSIQFYNGTLTANGASRLPATSHTFLSLPSSQQFVPFQTPSFLQSAVVAVRFQLTCTASSTTNILPISDCRSLTPTSTPKL